MSKKEKKPINKITRILLIIIGVLLLLVSLVRILDIVLEEKQAQDDQNNLLNIINDISEDDSIKEEEEKEITLTGKSFNELLEINNDFKGWLSFKSGLINQPIVQTTDNNYYLSRSFFGKKSSIGTAFLDAYQTLSSQNMTIYGHLVYRNNALMFSPLHKLTEQSNYEANRYFTFTTATEVRTYEVAIVFYYDINEDATTIPYHYGNFTEAEFNQYIRLAKEKQFYDTGVEVTYEDNIITLQTCVKNEDDLRLIVVGKLIGSEPIQ